jgi:hypothetical protein
VRIGRAEYGYYAPQIHEMYLKLPVEVDPVGGDGIFVPTAVEIDGRKAPYVFYYFNGTTLDYLPHPGKASDGKIELFVPVHWRANERHDVTLHYTLKDQASRTTVSLPTPKTGGAWAGSTDNIAYRVREEAGLARVHEPVDIDLTVARERFPDPERRIRATVMTAPGAFTEIPCQVYGVQMVTLVPRGGAAPMPLQRFRVVVPLTVKPKTDAIVHLWVCPPREKPANSAIRLEGGALGGVVSNTAYRITLQETSGQILAWFDRRVGVHFQLQGQGVEAGPGAVIHRTPDLFGNGKEWSHVLDWKSPAHRDLAGPVMVETARWGEMPWMPEAVSKVQYRFFADRPEVRAVSSLRLTKDIEGLAVRGGGFIFSPELFTHFAWPEGDGVLRRVTVAEALGNDMGAPPPACFPVATPWVAAYHQERKYGFALMTLNYAYFSDGPGHANEARARAYVSNYRNRFLYTVRASMQTYCANICSYPTPLEAGTTLYEDVVYLPFAFKRENKEQFEPVWALYRELKNPLVIEP